MDTLERLSQIKIFEPMSGEERLRWAHRFKRQQYVRGEVVIRQNDRPTAFYIVDRGELRACARDGGRVVPRAYFYPGDHFGETGLLTGASRNATIDVLSDAELLVLDELDFDQLVEEFPEIRDYLFSLSRQREQAGRMRFDWQAPDEVTVFFSTKHWVAFLRALRLPFLIAIIGTIFALIYLRPGLGDIPATILMLLSGTLLALATLLSVYHFFDWRNDDYIVTSRRILHVERVFLMREDRDEAPIERVQDVQVRQDGILANLLNFGHVTIQTAAATERILFAHVPRPSHVRDMIFAPMNYTRTRERAEVRETIRQELGQRLKIPVSSLEGSAAVEISDDIALLTEQGLPGETEDAFAVFGWLRQALWRLRAWFTFETWIKSDDGMTITWRKNGWLLIRVSIPSVLAGLTVVVLIVWSLSQNVGVPLIPLALLLAFLIIFSWWFYVYWDWQNDIYQISGNRLIDLKKRPLFLAEIRRETTLDRVENIALSIPSPIAKILNYGTVIIETAGETGAFRFEYVHDPRAVQAEIFDRREGLTRHQHEQDRRRRHAEMVDWFEIYEELKQSGDGNIFGSET